MTDTDCTHATLIRSLGGKAKLADALGLDRDVVTKWHVRGIPAKYWHSVVEMACDRDIRVTFADLVRTKPDNSGAAG